MPFDGLYYTNGQSFTYKDFMLMSNGVFAACVVVSSVLLAIWCSIAMNRHRRQIGKDNIRSELQSPLNTSDAHPTDCAENVASLHRSGPLKFCRFGLCSFVSVVYQFAIILIAILNNALLINGTGNLFWSFIGYLVGVQILVALVVRMLLKIGSSNQGPADLVTALLYTIFYTVWWNAAIYVVFVLQLPTMFDSVVPSFLPLTCTVCAVVMSACTLVLASHYVASTTDTHLLYDDSNAWSPSHLPRYFRIRPYVMIASIVVGLITGVFIAGVLRGSCVTYFDPVADEPWITLGGTVRWNSGALRRWFGTPACPPGSLDPCHVYITLGADLSKDVFINVHFPIPSPSVVSILVWDSNMTSPSIRVLADEFSSPLLAVPDQRAVYAAYIPNLQPGTCYNFSILTTNSESPSKIVYQFCTTPLSRSEIRFVVAGDGGVTEQTRQIVRQMAIQRPHFAVIGGDVAYDNGLIPCACAWDGWLQIWESEARVDGKYLIPLVFSVGNHDLGANDNNSGALDGMFRSCDPSLPSHAMPPFLSWFPAQTMTTGEDNNKTTRVRPVCARTTLRKHKLPTVVNLWMLDTAYAVSPAANVDFVNINMNVPAGEIDMINMAVYHVPLYTSVRSSFQSSKYLRDIWVPSIFDKYNFSVCFENHAHSYKRTLPLRNSTVVPPGDQSWGTVYVGDGKMGVAGQGIPTLEEITTPAENNIFAHNGVQYHFFLVRLVAAVEGGWHMNLTMINNKGLVFDSTTIR